MWLSLDISLVDSTATVFFFFQFNVSIDGMHPQNQNIFLQDVKHNVSCISHDLGMKIHTCMQGSTLALARLPGASKIPCRASKISKCSNLLK